MKYSIITQFFLLTFISSILFSCQKEQSFSISGQITDAENKILYLEQIGISKINKLDSVQLNTSGNYKFKQPRPVYPDFYRLRLGNQMINLAIDSTESLTVNAPANTFATDYSLNEENTVNLKIKELTLLQLQSSKEYNRLSKQFNDKEIDAKIFEEEAYKVINNYKNQAKEIIHFDFINLSAYYALFQQINSFIIFDPYNKEDNKLFGAVANAWIVFYPESPRAVQMKNIYLTSRASFREINPLVIDSVDSRTLFDISLPSLDGKEIRLSEVSNGKTVLIDFTSYAVESSPGHNRMLAELHNKFDNLVIYQVSLDADDHFWKNATINLPWICVRDPKSIYSTVAQTYNVTQIPSTFLMNKNGVIVYKVDDYKNLEKEIQKL